jgi:hypothetical protein
LDAALAGADPGREYCSIIVMSDLAEDFKSGSEAARSGSTVCLA